MTRYIVSIFLALMSFVAKAQSYQDFITQQKVKLVDSDLVLNMRVDFSNLTLSKCHGVVFTPVVTRGDSAQAFPSIVVNGKERHTLYRRLKRPAGEMAMTIEKAHKAPVDYRGAVTCKPWMVGAQIVLVTDSCGCGWGNLAHTAPTPQTIATLEHIKHSMNAMSMVYPLCYMEPETLDKTLKPEGRAFLDFPVNRTDIQLEYRKNAREIAKIAQTIGAVKDVPNAQITHIHIHGYASPEGSLTHNTQLANERAATLRKYVSLLVDLPEKHISIQSTPEDWEGLQRYVADSAGIDHRQEILQIIKEEADLDKREARIRESFPDVYKYMLQHWFPALRHTDYTISYTVRQTTLDEVKKVYRKRPQRLSLHELYRLALSYDAQSAERYEVMQTAACLYPESAVASLNAANVAIASNKLAEAQMWLVKAGNQPAAIHARGVLAAKQGDYATARRLFTEAASQGIQESTEALDLLPQAE